MSYNFIHFIHPVQDIVVFRLVCRYFAYSGNLMVHEISLALPSV